MKHLTGPARVLLLGAFCLLTSLCGVSAALTAEEPVIMAAAGEPFGVGAIKLPLDGPLVEGVTESNGYSIENAEGRVFYPVFGHQRLISMLRQLVGRNSDGPDKRLIVFFLFRGDTPFTVTTWTPDRHEFEITPVASDTLRQDLLQEWWNQYTTAARLQQNASDYPPILQIYLSSMLARRLGLALPDSLQNPLANAISTEETLGVIFNSEPMRLRKMEESLKSNDLEVEPANLALPPPIPWNPDPDIEVADQPELEPIASYVPEECYYVRFGNFNNFQWARQLIEQNGGSVQRMITLRGHDARLSQRAQDQLGVKETSMSRLFGSTVIADVALIGRDVYLGEGAAVGVLFQAKNELLGNELMKQRQEAVHALRSRGASISDMQIDGHTVSVAATDDNRLRSYYVRQDNFHLITNCETIARRFLAASKGDGRLADLPEFQAARARYPLSDQTTVFGFLSTRFLRALFSPRYQIELRRRLQAVAELEVTQIARLVAINESLPYDTIESLLEENLLPYSVLNRPDHSYVAIRDGTLVDSLRGARGYFLPIPDIEVEAITASEQSEFERVTNFFMTRWPRLYPLVVQVQRSETTSAGHERVTLDLEAMTFDPDQFEKFTSRIGPPTRRVIHQDESDAITLQVVMQGGQVKPRDRAYHLFVGLQDRAVPARFGSMRFLRLVQAVRTAPIYIGAWPRLNVLSLLPIDENSGGNDQPLLRLPFGFWQGVTPTGLNVLGSSRETVDTAAKTIYVTEADDEAQIRFRVRDLTQTNIKTWFAGLDHQRAYETSIGNTRMLNMLQQQLGINHTQSLYAAQSILGVELICALGGVYETFEHENGLDYWTSSHWPQNRSTADGQPEVISPLLAWFRGIDAKVTMTDQRLVAHADVTLDTNAVADYADELLKLLKNQRRANKSLRLRRSGE